MFTDSLRRAFKFILDPLSKFLAWYGVAPNVLTVFGFLLHFGVAYLLYTGSFFWGGLAMAGASAFDGVDGALARASGKTTKFGAFLDSTLDRYSEAVVYLGLLAYYGRNGQVLPQILVYGTIIGSLLVSYTRARAEGLGVECKEGLFTRVERVLVLCFFLLINQMVIGLAVLALLANVTAVQRIYAVWRRTNGDLSAGGPQKL
jgi:CDP-diacylglycerol---glycerol-3-phosphate 3-phosphatidyltransferase